MTVIHVSFLLNARVSVDDNLNFVGHMSKLCTKAHQKVKIHVHLHNTL